MVMEYMKEKARCQKQPQDTGEEQYDAEMFTKGCTNTDNVKHCWVEGK
jgi:hypothetical protein